ncbi:MAG: serine hydroxymethyltransferase [Candidatus Pelagibacterales bacterium]|jgi:glycine hydroxymethyltransferase|tara:strand:- start:354 stop:1616 length:1263 start_codon:yes stop_codon:yes gene_type:complete
MSFFRSSLSETDKDIANTIDDELNRQRNQIELIASENIVSKAVLEAQGSIHTNKYAEGYPGSRYYGGCEYVDMAEELAISRVKELYKCSYANVQPHSGAQANGAVFLALLQPNDTILGMSLDAGGHLTHGAAPSQSGKWFNAVQYGVNENGLIDYEQVEELAKKHNPKLIIAGGSAYSRKIDFKKFREVADLVGAYLMVDMAHYSGLIAAGEYPNPIEFADVVTSTTHKTIRGPRGGMILSNNNDLGKKFNSAVFPGLQGGPLMHVIAAKAVAFGEALKPEFKTYIKAVISNAQILGETLIKHGFNLASGGTDTHLLLVDLTPKNLTGNVASTSLERANITCNKNSIPFDPKPPKVTSGIRIGTPAATTRGFNNDDFIKVGNLIAETLEGLQKNSDDNSKAEESVKAQVKELCDKYPIYN